MKDRRDDESTSQEARTGSAARRGRRHLDHELIRQEQRFVETFEHAPIGMALVGLDGQLFEVNRSMCEMLGYDRDSLCALRFQDITHPDDLQRDFEEVQRLLDGRGDEYRMEKRYLARDGSVVDVQLDVFVLRDERRQPLHFISQIQNITERKRVEAELWESRELAQVTLSSIEDGVIRTDEHGVVTFCNSAACLLLGCEASSLIGQRFAEAIVLYSPDDEDAQIPDPVAQVLATGQPMRIPFFTRLQRDDGRLCPIADSVAPLRSHEGRLIGSVFVFHDVSVMHQMTQRLAYEAMHDTLTGLPNRRAFENTLERLVEDARSSGRRHTLLYIDIDHFKSINDAAGHMAGDELLREVAMVLRATLRSRDMVARMGGDEFAVILLDTDEEAAVEQADALIDAIRGRSFEYQSRVYSIRISVGLTGIDAGTRDPMAPMIQADTAIYVAKGAGRDRIHRYDSGSREISEAALTLGWLQRLRRAMDEERFEIHLQCIFDLDRRICGYEALIRLRGDDGGLTMPGEFLPAAGRLGLLPQIDEWVITHVLGLLEQSRQQGRWVEGRYVSANLSARSIGDELFRTRLLQMLDRSGIAPDGLVFEITETEFLGEHGAERALLDALRERGYKLWIDDFGSGYSSFERLKRLPFDGVKADGTFTQRLDSDPIDQALLEAVCTIGRKLSFPVVAEGVEDRAIFELLRSIGIERFQGHWFHAAEPWHEALARG